MDQLVREQSLTGAGFRCILAAGEDQIAPERESSRANRLRRTIGGFIVVHANAAEVVTESWAKRGLH
jgi:hypothetical protein